ncbi:MAG: hypothetical protein ACI87E_002156 [Mariniblastus sp.]|jgi:hypothetical protein
MRNENAVGIKSRLATLHPGISISTFLVLVLLLASCSKKKATQNELRQNELPTVAVENQRMKQTLNETPLPQIQPQKEPLFRRMLGSETGIEFENILIENDLQNILTYSYMYNGGGVSVGDINNDGLVDLFFTSNQGSNCLYLNRGGMRFEDISEASGISTTTGWHSGVNMCDINSDGHLDIYVCRSGPGLDPAHRKNLLLINDGNLQFSEQAESYGIADSNHSTQASFFDYDRDGDLDLYVLNHPVFFGFATAREAMEKVKDHAVAKANTDNLYRNNGDGSFTNITDSVGLKNFGYGLGLVTADINGDGWTDIYVANDFSTPDFMYINQKNGTFVDQIKTRTGHIPYFGMGCDIIDVNADLTPDLVVLDMTAQDRVRSKTLMPSMSSEKFWGLIGQFKYHYQYMFNTLQLNQGNGNFSDIALLAGVAKTDWSWAVLGADFDHDGWDDLVITNGFRRDSKDNDFLARFRAAKMKAGGRRAMIENQQMMEWVEQIPSQRIRNYLFRNNGDLTFTDKSVQWGFVDGSFSNGAAYADLDNDGDLDLVINNLDDPAFIYQNQSEKAFPNRKFVSVQPVDEHGQPVMNAKVKVAADGHSQMKEMTTCRGFQSAVAPILHFGLGEVENVESITVYWPDESVSILESVEPGKNYQIKSTGSSPRTNVAGRERFFHPSAKQINWRHRENPHNEYSDEILLPHSQSTLGPCLVISDVNGDGREDLFVGGAHGTSQELLMQTTDADFIRAGPQNWQPFIGSENVDAVFFDADSDGDDDLYVANGGGSEFSANDPLLCDQFFRNENGRLEFEPGAIPKIPVSSGAVVTLDFDADGDLDLFVGGRLVPGKYPFSPKSYFLENENGTFSENRMMEIDELGMINDAIATDFNADGRIDLIAVGEWTPPVFLENIGDGFKRVAIPGTEKLNGWWFSITEMDANSDGRPDYLLGNLGMNNKFKSKSGAQLRVLCNDFDSNGSYDIVLATEVDGRVFPVRGKECSTQQMPFLKDKFKSYHDFALADLSEILGKTNIDDSLQLEVNTFASCVLIATEEGFKKVDLPNPAQMAPIRDALAMDINDDGHLDIVAVGNLYNAEVETVRYDAGLGLVLLGDGTGQFEAVLSGDSGLGIRKDSRQLEIVKTRDGEKVVIANNHGSLVLLDLK